MFVADSESTTSSYRSRAIGRTVHAPAKINLFLDVLGKREDGFHEVVTLITAINLFDTLSFRVTDDPTIRFFQHDARAGNGFRVPIPTDATNLVVKAANLLKNYAEISAGAEIHLTKRIPAAGGLGGGSSDAASVIETLAALWGIPLGPTERFALGEQLGSDVNVFLDRPRAALCQGRGEQIEVVRGAVRLPIVLACPPVGASTVEVFREYRHGDASVEVGPMIAAWNSGSPRRVARQLHNSLEPAALRVVPALNRIRDAFERVPVLGHRITGSGSSWFGLCQTHAESRKVARMLQQRLNCPVFSVSTIF